MQTEMERIKRELAAKTVVGESAAGMVTVTMNGANRVLSVKIASELVNPYEVEMLEDLVLAAINNATEKAAALAGDEMNKMGGMMPNIPGLNLGQ